MGLGHAHVLVEPHAVPDAPSGVLVDGRISEERLRQLQPDGGDQQRKQRERHDSRRHRAQRGRACQRATARHAWNRTRARATTSLWSFGRALITGGFPRRAKQRLCRKAKGTSSRPEREHRARLQRAGSASHSAEGAALAGIPIKTRRGGRESARTARDDEPRQLDHSVESEADGRVRDSRGRSSSRRCRAQRHEIPKAAGAKPPGRACSAPGARRRKQPC